jgi:Ca2+-transporting ATPase
MKRLPAVETLGSTSAICSDKTGTLTLNKMTARELAIPGQNRFTVSGEGYGTEGEIKHVGGSRFDLDAYLLPMILCADALLDGESLIGDPTEGALIVLGAKGGLDIDETRATYPRIAEVPFDSDYKFMATFHEMQGAGGAPVVRCYVKGAPDVLISKGGSYREPDGTIVPVTDENRHLALEANDRMAEGGERVMVVAQRDLDPATFDPNGDLLGLVQDLTLLAMIGIVDPPRPEAKAAIAECKSAGIRVRMITGDHATTAGAIGGELGIEGRAITGAEFAAMSDEDALAQLPDIGVIARVAPEDKVRLVRLLQQSDNIVAMTGDGVNDAPALKSANIGVAMGITGTEVSKEAAVMILTDDNFATIVGAVEYGRALYDNLLKYLRFQMSTLVAYIAIFIGAGIFDIANGIPLNPLQILWLNFVIDIPIAVALGFDEPTIGLMERRPRPVGAPVLSTSNWVRLCAQGAVMTIGTLVVYEIGAHNFDVAVASTMLLTTLSLYHLVAGLLARDQLHTIFNVHSLPGPTQLRRYGFALAAIILVTEIGFLQRVFSMVELTFSQWWICIGIALTLLVFEEILKFFIRRRSHTATPAVAVSPPAVASKAA